MKKQKIQEIEKEGTLIDEVGCEMSGSFKLSEINKFIEMGWKFEEIRK